MKAIILGLGAIWKMIRKNIVYEKAFVFAKKIVKLCKSLNVDKKEYVLSRQILRSGTSIGANIKESQNAQSKRDFVSKLSIALKEAGETEYWLDLLAGEYLGEKEVFSLKNDLIEIIKILTAIVKKVKNVR